MAGSVRWVSFLENEQPNFKCTGLCVEERMDKEYYLVLIRDIYL